MDGLYPLSRYLKFTNVNIFGTVFLLHSRFTVVCLLASIVILSTKPYFHEPIKCMTNGESNEMYDDFCWSMGTYILVNNNGTLNESKDKINMKGYAASYGLGTDTYKTKRIYFRYYQWVILLLFQQAIFLYFPSYLWKIWENKRLEKLCADISITVVPDEVYYEKKLRLFNYFTSDNRIIHQSYVKKYIICEGLNLMAVCVNMLSMYYIFNGFWTNYLPALIKLETYEWNNWDYVTSTIFPKIAKCEFNKYGYSGTIVSRDLYCLLPLNILNEKIFGFLGFWYIFLSFLSICIFLLFTLSIFNRNFRIHMIHRQATNLSQNEIHQFLKNKTFADWYFLCKISTNVGPVMFADLMCDLASFIPTSITKATASIKPKD